MAATAGFELEITTDASSGLVRLQLRDSDGRHRGAHQVRLDAASGALWEGLFDTRAHVERYQGGTRFTDRPATAEDLLDRLGLFLGGTVLGPDITACLADGVHHRTLLVRLPEIVGKEDDDLLGAAFARVPWEIARPAVGEAMLMERNVVVRAVTAGLDVGTWMAPPPPQDQSLRVLLVFAEAPGSRPLAMRLERETLLDLFYQEVMPSLQVRVDVLCHGVTRKRLREQVETAGGYHVVHWSGHGHNNLLELYGEDGGSDLLTGEELLGLFAEAGGFLPNLVVLSACLSGAFVDARDWATLRAALVGTAGGTGTATREAEIAAFPRAVAERPGYAGTALALLRAGVPQAIAMRYEVGDAYARDFAHGFYRRLLAQQAPKAPATALALVRGELLRARAPEHGAVDHATPLVFGRDLAPLSPPAGRSRQLRERRPQPQPLLAGGSTELDRPTSFVGRGAALTELRGRWLEAGAPAVAVVQGLAGLGKTALVAEAIHLWHRSFDYVIAFQSKPTPITVDDFLRRLDQRLARDSRAYSETCDQYPNRCVYLPPGPRLVGEARYELLRDNLVEALRDERLLVVLDNFETQLETVAGEDGYSCGDPEWDALLAHLAAKLPGTGSRVVLTSRHRLAALASPERALTVALGPLPMEEAVLFLQDSPALRRLAFGNDEGWVLARRLLIVSRGHPLILTRLGTLAEDRPALAAALTELETGGLGRLPDVFTARLSETEREAERRYLEDVAVRSVDLLLERLTPEARRLLWVVTRASEPVPEPLLEGVWSGQSLEEEQAVQLRSLLAMADRLPEEIRAQLDRMPPELRAAVEATSDRSAAPPLAPLLEVLFEVGLLTTEAEAVGFHELVKERSSVWMEARPAERDERTEAEVWRAYGERYRAAFQALRSASEAGARDRAAEAGRRGLAYLVRARAFGELGSFASELVTGTRDPSLLRAVIADLEAVADQVPAGRDRWSLRTNLADALRMCGRPDAALALYEQSAAEAETIGDWEDVGWICQNWANALGDVGRLDTARTTYERSADAKRLAGSPRVLVIGSELEALRIDVMQGGAEHALPEIERRLVEVRRWWLRQRSGEAVAEAPDAVLLGRALVAALDVADDANRALERWPECLDLLEEIEAAKRSLGEGKYELAITRFNRYAPLLGLGRLDEAQRLLESCLQVFHELDDLPQQAQVLSALANLWNERGDYVQAVALGRQTLAVRTRLPDLKARANSHGNLSIYLARFGDRDGVAAHLLAAMIYLVITKHQGSLATLLDNISVHMDRAAADGSRYELPRLAELLQRPEFVALCQVLAERDVDVGELQATIDGLVEQVRSQIEAGG
jgi:tetratricopeptide (TPR) repeat protein